MTCSEIRAELVAVMQAKNEKEAEIKEKEEELFADEHDGVAEKFLAKERAELAKERAELAKIKDQISSLGAQVERECYVRQPQDILQIQYQNPDHLVGFNASEIVWGGSDPTPVIGGTFPSVDAKQEWKQVLEPHDADYEGESLVGATGWALNPEFSDVDLPFYHPFGFDWEFTIALDQPQDDPTKYTFLLARGNQSQQAEGSGDAIEQATAMHVPLPIGPDNIPSVLGVEIDRGVIPNGFTELHPESERGGLAPGDRVAVFGRWIVDCGHEVEVADVKSYRTEIHPPLLMASARVTHDSLVNAQAKAVTRVLFASRAYLVSQRFTTDTDTIYDDTAGDDGPFVDHMVNEVIKVDSFRSLSVEAHPKIKSFPFDGKREAHFIVKPPPPPNPFINPGRLYVSYQFTVRSGCSVTVTPGALGAIEVVITLDQDGYTPPALPTRKGRSWPRDELDELRDGTGTQILEVEALAGVIEYLLTGPLGAIAVEVILEILGNGGIETDEYAHVEDNVDIYDASRAFFSVSVTDLPTTKGVTQDDSQPFPVYGWLEVGYEPLTHHV